MYLVSGGKYELSVKGYVDASFQTDLDKSRYQFGFMFTLNGGVVTWSSYKQETIVDSIIESQYITTNEVTKEAVWLKKLLIYLGIVPSIVEPVEIFSDNEGAVVLTKEPRDHKCMMHIKRKFHLI